MLINPPELFEESFSTSVEFKDGKVFIKQNLDDIPGLIIIPETQIEKLFKAIKSVIPALINKAFSNKEYYTQNKPFPVRLGPLKDIIQREALKQDHSAHWVMKTTLEGAFYDELKQEAEPLVAVKFGEIKDLVSSDIRLAAALDELGIDETLFVIGMTDKNVVELLPCMTDKDREYLMQKRGFYKRMEGVTTVKVVDMPELFLKEGA